MVGGKPVTAESDPTNEYFLVGGGSQLQLLSGQNDLR